MPAVFVGSYALGDELTTGNCATVPLKHALWVAGEVPVEVTATALSDEAELEAMIVAEPRILSDEWMLVGQQENTGTGGVVDLLAIAPDDLCSSS